MKIRLPTILLALLLLTTPVQANGLGNDKAAHITTAAAAVSMLGVLPVRDDGTCEVNGYCKVADGGIATKANSDYRVVARVADNIIKALFR